MAKPVGKRGKAEQRQWRLPAWPLLGRWLLGLTLFGAMGGGAAWGLLQLRDPRVMPLNVVRIDGDFRHLDRSELEKAVGEAIRGNFFTVDVEAVRAAAHRLAWVDEVSVRRVWPGTLKMQVKEQVPLARWGEAALVNGRGEVFEPRASELPEGLPRLAGPDGSGSEVVAEYLRIGQALAPLGLQVAELATEPRGGWRMVDGGGMALQLGTRDQGARLARFIRVYPRLLAEDPRPLAAVDLRYTNGLAVVRGELPPPQAEESEEPGADRGTRGGSRV